MKFSAAGLLRRVLVGFLLSVISLVLVLLLIEGALRLVTPPLPQTEGSIHQPSANIRLVYELKPNSQGLMLGAPVQVNSIGLRDVEYSRDKPEGVFRIIVLGDSWTFGTGVSLEDTYVKQLEARLNVLGTRRFQVINAGIGGGNIVRALEMLKARGLLDYDPDLVLLGYNIHNVELGHQYVTPAANQLQEGTAGTNPGKRVYTGPQYGPIPYSMISYLRDRLHIVNFFGYRLETLLKGLSLRDWETLYEEEREEWQVTRESLTELAELTSSRSIPTLIAMFPVLINFKGSYPHAPVHEIIHREVESNGMLFADITPAFDGINSQALWIHPSDRHPDSEGHRILAEGLLKALIAYGLVSSS